MRSDCGEMLGVILIRQNSAMDSWVQGLNSAAHHLGKARVILYGCYRNTCRG